MSLLERIRQDPQAFRNGARAKGLSPDVSRILTLDTQRKSLLTKLEEQRALRKRLSKGEPSTEERIVLADLGTDIARLESSKVEMDREIGTLLVDVPNLPLETVPAGAAQNNVIVREEGREDEVFFPHKSHEELGKELEMIDFEKGVSLAGSRFVVLKGMGAKLQRALAAFCLDEATDHGYLEVSPPLLVKREIMEGTGQLPKFEDDAFRTSDDLFLIPTAEVPVTNLYRGDVIDFQQLPIRHVAFTPCWRREAGSAGKDTRGYLRLHQFEKVELVSFAAPEQMQSELDKLVSDASRILEKLGLRYRVVLLAAGDMGFTQAITYDLEVWAPGIERWLEVSSCSAYGTFQAERANLRFRRGPQGKPESLCTLNGSALGLPRTVVAIMESFQLKEGGIRVPEVLRPYMRNVETIQRPGHRGPERAL